MNLILFPVKSIYQPMINFSRVISLRYFFYKPFVAWKYSYYNSGNKLKSVYDDAVLQSTYPKIREAFGLLFYLYTMAKAAKKKAAPKKRAEHYEPKVKTDLSFDELIAMSVGNKQISKNKMTKVQTKIVNSIKNTDFSLYEGGNVTISVQPGNKCFFIRYREREFRK